MWLLAIFDRDKMNTAAVCKKLQDIKILEDVEERIVQTAALLASLSPETIAMLDSGMTFEECQQFVQNKLSKASTNVVGSNNHYKQMLNSDNANLAQCISAMNHANAKLSGSSETIYNRKTGQNETLVLSSEAVRLIQSKEMTCSEVISQWEKDVFGFMMGLHKKTGANNFSAAPKASSQGFPFVAPPCLTPKEESNAPEHETTATICEQLDVLEEMLASFQVPDSGYVCGRPVQRTALSLADLIAVAEACSTSICGKASFHKKLARLWERLDHQTQGRLSQGDAINTIIQELSTELADKNKSLSKVPPTLSFNPQQ